MLKIKIRIWDKTQSECIQATTHLPAVPKKTEYIILGQKLHAKLDKKAAKKDSKFVLYSDSLYQVNDVIHNADTKEIIVVI